MGTEVSALREWNGGRCDGQMASGSGGHMEISALVTLQGGEGGRLLMTVSLPDHVLPAGLTEVHGEVFGVPGRVCSLLGGLHGREARRELLLLGKLKTLTNSEGHSSLLGVRFPVAHSAQVSRSHLGRGDVRGGQGSQQACRLSRNPLPCGWEVGRVHGLDPTGTPESRFSQHHPFKLIRAMWVMLWSQ